MKLAPLASSDDALVDSQIAVNLKGSFNTMVADAIVKVVDAPFGKRPFRVHIDPSQDGADIAFGVMDRVRAEMLHRVGMDDLLHPRLA